MTSFFIYLTLSLGIITLIGGMVKWGVFYKKFARAVKLAPGGGSVSRVEVVGELVNQWASRWGRIIAKKKENTNTNKKINNIIKEHYKKIVLIFHYD